MTKMRIFLISALVLLALALAGCSTEDGMIGETAEPTVPAQTVEPAMPDDNGILTTAEPTAESTVAPAPAETAEAAPEL